MLKKKLIKENLALFERLDKANEKISHQGKLIKELEDKISELEILLEQVRTKEVVATEQVTNDEQSLEAKQEIIQENKEINDVEYGSSVIGKIVVAATEKSNKLSASAQTPEIKEQINLILGKTEVAKSEILAVVLSEMDLNEKIKQMDKIMNDAFEYFEGVMQQYQ